MRYRSIVAVLVLSGGLAVPGLAQPDLGTEAQRETGRRAYDEWCAQCHGEEGAGDGPAGPYLKPAPRDFTSAKYQVRSTPTGYLPTDEDIARVIRDGIPGTAMPAFPNLSKAEVTGLVAYLKTFSEDFQDPGAYADPIPVPDPPAFDEDNLEAARRVYEETGCARCHGDEGRGDGPSAPTLTDDWGQHVRAADLTRPWTFDGGASRRDIYRSISTGFNGTPMAGFADGLTEEQRWQIVDFITAVSDGKTEPGWASLVQARIVEGEIDLGEADELFADAPAALFPVFGQIVEPGREFHPGVIAVEARAVVNREEIALRVAWHDFQANTRGSNAPDIQVPPEEVLPSGAEAVDEEDEEAGDEGFWGEAAAEEPEPEQEEDFWGDAAVEEEPAGEGTGDEDFWGEAAADEEEGFWETDTGAEPAAPSADTSEWSDALAVQFPHELPEGIRKPYFLFGDSQNPVDLWYLDLGRPEEAQLWEARGSGNLSRSEGLAPTVAADYEAGRWTVTFKRRRDGRGVTFPEDTFVPIAFSVWDGFFEERGSRRGLTSWFDLYVPPMERPSPWPPVIRTVGLFLGLEILLVGLVRWRRGRGEPDGSGDEPEETREEPTRNQNEHDEA